MTKDRLDRINDFQEFSKNAYDIFTEFLKKDNRVNDFEEIYKLNVYPKKETEEHNKRAVEISWGIRKYERIIDGNKKKVLVEHGATLYYERLDSGYVVILLYPAHTENRMPIEDSITLKRRIDPKRLKNKSFLKENWNDLIAYMENTSLDGNPSILQRTKISYLRTFKHLIIDHKSIPTRFSNYLKETSKFVFSIGLSGFLIFFITYHSQNENEKIRRQQIDISNKLMNCFSIKLDSVLASQSLLKTLHILNDSIDYKTKQILKKMNDEKVKK